MSAADDSPETDLPAPVFYDAPPESGPELDDVLAPTFYADEAAPRESGRETLLVPGVDSLDEEFPEASDGGFSDPDNIVRVWLTDGRLIRVRLSTSWFRRLGKRPLSDVFGQALFLAGIDTDAEPDASDPENFDAGTLPEPSFEAVGVVIDAMSELAERHTSILEALAGRSPVEARSAGVTVGLDTAGRVLSVSFDPAWLENVQTGEITDRVVRCAAQAQERFAAEGGDGGLSQVADTQAWLSSVLKRMLLEKENSGV